MGTCFGISSSTEIKKEQYILERTISQSTNLTGNSATSDQNTLNKSVVKRYVHQNKRSHLAYFHDNPLLQPITSNKLYMSRKPDAIAKLVGSLPIIDPAYSTEKITTRAKNGSSHQSSNLKNNTFEFPQRLNRLGLKRRSQSFNVFKE